jgi:hypothetical protein
VSRLEGALLLGLFVAVTAYTVLALNA